MITSMAYILLLALPGALVTVSTNPPVVSEGVKLADVLTKESWAYEVSLGPPNHRIAIESRTLTFCADGHVRERIADDTGGGDLYGTWSLERTDQGDVLTLSGEYLRDHGRFSIKYLEKEKAIDLWVGSPERALRFQSVKTEHDPCTPPK